MAVVGAGDFAFALGRRLRSVREQQGLTLRAAAEQSKGRFAPSLLGAYERAERAVSVTRLAELADLYRVPVEALVPESDLNEAHEQVSQPIVIDLARLERVTAEQEAIGRFIEDIRRRRGDEGLVLTIRRSDVAMLSALLALEPHRLVSELPLINLPDPAGVGGP